MNKAVIFDMDGILIDSEMMYHKRMVRYLKHKNIHCPKEELLSIIGGSYPMYQRFVKHVLKIEDDVEDFFNDMNNYCGGPFTDYPSILFDHEMETLQRLRQDGYRLAVASSSKLDTIHEVLSSCRIDDLFEFYLSGEMFHESKPHPEIYLTAAKKMNLSQEDCLVIEDSPYGITAGKRAGMTVIARREERLAFDQSLADHFFDDYRQLPALVADWASENK